MTPICVCESSAITARQKKEPRVRVEIPLVPRAGTGEINISPAIIVHTTTNTNVRRRNLVQLVSRQRRNCPTLAIAVLLADFDARLERVLLALTIASVAIYERLTNRERGEHNNEL